MSKIYKKKVKYNFQVNYKKQLKNKKIKNYIF